MGGLVGGLFGMGKARKGRKAAEAGMAQAQESIAQAIRDLESVGIPSVEAQKIILESPELVGLLEAEELGPSELENIVGNYRLQEKQRDALAGLEEVAEEGFTEEDKARYEAMLGQAAGEEQARQESILQSMAERGALDSGAQLAAQLSSAQSDTGDARQQALNMMAQSAQARRQAMQQVGQMSGQMEQQDFQRQRDAALAADEISRFNLANRQDVARSNLAQRQQLEGQRVDTANRQQQYNKALLQQEYQNKMAKQQALANARMGQATQAMNIGQQKYGMRADQAQGLARLGQGLDQAAYKGAELGIEAMGSIGGMIGGSDKDKKKNIEKLKSSEIREFLRKLKPYKYEYKDEKMGKGKRTGIMAQDLEKTEMGKDAIIDTKDGKMVNGFELATDLAAAMGDINSRLEKLEGKGKNYSNGGIPITIDPNFQKGFSSIRKEIIPEQNWEDLGSMPTEDKLDKTGTSDMPMLENDVSVEPELENRSLEQIDRTMPEIKDREIIERDPLLRDKLIGSRTLVAKDGGVKYAGGGLANMQEYSDEEKLNEYETLKQLGVVGATGYACGGTKKDKYAGGGYEKMGYEEGGPQTSGRIVPGDEFAGDELPDRINSGEAVLNVDMQQRILDKLRELRQLRTDEMVEIGEAKINPEAQQELIDISRGDLPLEQADLSENVVEPTEKGMARLMKMLGME